MGLLIMAEDITTIKLPKTLKEELDSLKYYEKEPVYNVVKRLIVENNQLKEDKKQLFQLLINKDELTLEGTNFNKVYGFLLSLDNIDNAEEVQLQVMEIYLKDIIEEDPTSVIEAVDMLIETTVNENTISTLKKFKNYVKTSS